MKHKLAEGLLSMYTFIDQKDALLRHDVMIFKDQDAVVKWHDELVKWPATRAGRPILEWVTCFEREEANWWTGVVIGGWTGDTESRLKEMGASLKFLKPAAGKSGYFKDKCKMAKIKGKPVCVYNARKAKDAGKAIGAMQKACDHFKENVPNIFGATMAADDDMVHELIICANAKAYTDHKGKKWDDEFEGDNQGHVLVDDCDKDTVDGFGGGVYTWGDKPDEDSMGACFMDGK